MPMAFELEVGCSTRYMFDGYVRVIESGIHAQQSDKECVHCTRVGNLAIIVYLIAIITALKY